MSAKKNKKTKTIVIPLPVRCALWGVSAGHCEFAGCNKLLHRHPETKEFVNISEAAHIIGLSEDGPRGEKELSEELAKDITNLMLLCRICHKNVDANKGAYPVDFLRKMKEDHERRIEIQTGIDMNKRSHILLYGENIGHLSRHLDYREVAPALPPHWYPADTTPLARVDASNTLRDKDREFWENASKQLMNWVNQQVHPRLVCGEIKHLSVFALGPQPLLMLLGSLLTDIPPAQVYQLHREPVNWCWQENPEVLGYIIQEPDVYTGNPALVLSLSAPITDDRIHSVLGEGVSIWRVTIDKPDNDFVKAPEQLHTFRQLIRPLMDRIKAKHGQLTMLNVFPAAPVSLCVEFGRIQQPKAHMPLCIYDQVAELGGFVPVINIGGERS